ncbi:asparaginyl-tRNA synthetase-like isoform X2 [Babylonia areolata]|uniref:asparaginyl-tRNA synthetase-like isoform X2 n=1 Tax=Babylonia areolata TaxID=304850 RepID=UPI003FD1A203
MAAPVGRLLCVSMCRSGAVHGRLQLHRRYSKQANLNISSLLKDKKMCGSTISVTVGLFLSLSHPPTVGWVKSVRQQKNNVFLHISDGSGPQPLQVITSPDSLPGEVTFASCVEVNGELKESPAKGQTVELVADSIVVHGPCDTEKFPFGARHKHSADYCRGFLHLRPKTDSFASLLRLRSAAATAFHSYFQENGYLFVHTPILTSNDCEGGGEVFAVEPAYSEDTSSSDSEDTSSSNMEDAGRSGQSFPSSSDEDSKKTHFFSHPAFLTVSGQLHLEAVASVSRVYNFGPTFRAENSRGRHHLSEFYMVEAEIAFLPSLDHLLQIMEDMVRSTCQGLLEGSSSELDFYFQRQGTPQHKESLEKMIQTSFARLTYTEAVEELGKNKHRFQHKVQWGDDLKKEHEKFLTQQMGDVPVFITDFPAALKPFYAKANPDGQTVGAVDLLVPGVGELIGGSLREDNSERLAARLQPLGMGEQYRWYTELRQFGSSPHGGFGLGFERYLQFVLGTPNIKDTIPFPRWSRHCQL